MNHMVNAEFSHFQLRNNVQCIGTEEILMKTRTNTLSKYNPHSRVAVEMVVPNFTAVSYHALGDHILIGGMEGELMMTDMNKNVKFSRILSTEASRITNCVKMFMDHGKLCLLVCNNDKKVRIMAPDLEDPESVFEFPSCVNYSAISPDLKKIALCLDSTEDLIIDRDRGAILHTLEGHTDFGFSVDWDPSNEYCLATGNQDRSVMIWDIRQGSKLAPVHVLHSTMGAALNVQYSKNGKYLAFSESADFVNIFDKREFKERQSTDYFGEIAGFCFCEDLRGELSMFIGMADSVYCSLIELQENLFRDTII